MSLQRKSRPSTRMRWSRWAKPSTTRVENLATMLAASSLAAAEAPLTIDQLLAQGWEIAGYASGYDNRTSLILYRHPGVNALVQCGILYDVTRAQRTVVNCYELR